MYPKAPCKDCEKRHEGCHGKCEEYQAFSEERGRYNLELAKLQGYNVYITDRKAKIHDTMEKKKKR